MPEEPLNLPDRMASVAVSATLRLIALLPLVVSQGIGWVIGSCIYWFNTRAAKVTATNIALCLPDLPAAQQRRLARQSLGHTGKMMMESPAAWLGAIGRIRGWIAEVQDEALLEEAIAAGQGVVVILPHIGNWELINAYMAARPPERGDPEKIGLYAPPGKVFLRAIMAEVRERFGNEMVPTTPRGLARLFRCVAAGGVAVVLPDQVPAHGDFVPFFGHDCLTDRLIPRLVRKTGARVVCCVIERLAHGRGFRLRFSQPHPDIYSDDFATSMAALNKSVEQCVEQARAQYQWEYKRFKERPAGNLRVYNYENEPQTHFTREDELRVTEARSGSDKPAA